LGLAWQSSGEDSMLPMQGGAGFIRGPGTKIPKILLRFLVVWPEDFQKIRKKELGEKKKELEVQPSQPPLFPGSHKTASVRLPSLPCSITRSPGSSIGSP